MSFDLERILESKHALRRDLASRPIAEKLRMLDALRERALALRAAAPARRKQMLFGETPGALPHAARMTRLQLIAEKREASGKLIRTRPLFPYPQAAKYKGSGSTDEEKTLRSKDSTRN